MRIAFISDIHANLVALQAVLKDIDGRKVDRILCCGDIVGYYPFPNETIATLQEQGIEGIVGNHDRAVLMADTSWMNEFAAEAVRWTVEHLSASSREYLLGLPGRMNLSLSSISSALHHGSPENEDAYIYRDGATPGLLHACGCQCLVLGHTHVPFMKRFEEGVIVNPGSIGQPRDGDPRASYVIMDFPSMEAEFVRTGYDVEHVIDRVEAAGLPAILGRRLRYGF